jgi:hypothetical protein
VVLEFVDVSDRYRMLCHRADRAPTESAKKLQDDVAELGNLAAYLGAHPALRVDSAEQDFLTVTVWALGVLREGVTDPASKAAAAVFDEAFDVVVKAWDKIAG